MLFATLTRSKLGLAIKKNYHISNDDYDFEKYQSTV